MPRVTTPVVEMEGVTVDEHAKCVDTAAPVNEQVETMDD